MYELPEKLYPTKDFNTAFAREVLAYVEREHADFEFDMTMFYQSPVEAADLYHKPVDICKTSACLAGAAALLHPDANIVHRETFTDVQFHGVDSDWDEIGQKTLGLTDEGTMIFWVDSNEMAIDYLRQMIKMAEELQRVPVS